MSTSIPESLRTWTPPHCPNRKCRFHNHISPDWRYRRCGSHVRRVPPRRVPRFQCLACRRSFSSQTFDTTYWLKRPDLLPRILLATVNGMANRQIARAYDCAPSTVTHLLSRLGRHCLLFQRHLTDKASPPADITIDGLASFETSQYFPFEHLVAVDNDSSFILHFADAPLRRTGRMTAHQKRRRAELEAELGRPDSRAVEKAATELLREALRGAREAVVRSDLHTDYPRAIRHIDCWITHQTTSSRRHRDRYNALFEVNSLDSFLRHSNANHRRQTLAPSKRRQGSSERLAVFAVWRNFIKWRWENRCRQTAAMLRGIVARRLTVADVLSRRLFVTRIALSERWAQYYWRQVKTAVLPVNREHRLRYAY